MLYLKHVPSCKSPFGLKCCDSAQTHLPFAEIKLFIRRMGVAGSGEDPLCSKMLWCNIFNSLNCLMILYIISIKVNLFKSFFSCHYLKNSIWNLLCRRHSLFVIQKSLRWVVQFIGYIFILTYDRIYLPIIYLSCIFISPELLISCLIQ